MHLDTTFCIDLMREHHRGTEGPATRRFRALGETPVGVSVFVLCELHAGARLSARPRREIEKVEILARTLDIVYPDPTFPVAYGEAEAHLRKKGTPIPTMDLLIGVQAKLLGIPLLTRDPEHFRRIPSLIVETY